LGRKVVGCPQFKRYAVTRLSIYFKWKGERKGNYCEKKGVCLKRREGNNRPKLRKGEATNLARLVAVQHSIKGKKKIP